MDGSLSIPNGLRQQFEELERRLFRIDTIIAVCGGACALLLSFALIYLSDRLWDTPRWMRTIFTGAGAVVFGGFFYFYGRRWIWGKRSVPALAALVQRRYRRLGDRLLGIVELADEHKRPANFSPALCEAAIEQVAKEAAKVDFREAVGTKRPRRYLAAVVAAGLGAAAFFVFTPQAGWNALLRWIQPGVRVARYTFVDLENVPDHLVVAHGEPFEISVGLKARSFWHPSEISAQIERQLALTVPVRNGSAVFRFPGQTHAGVLTLRSGDVKRSVAIEPAFRPELKQLTAHIEPPAYLLYPPSDQTVEGGTLTVTVGSRVGFTGQVTRALKSAALLGETPVPLPVKGDAFTTPAFDGAAEFRFVWKDTLGLESAAPTKVRLMHKEDAAPRVECKNLAPALAVLEEEVVPIDLAATDDFGVKDLGIRWQIATKAGEDNAEVHLEERPIASGEPTAKTLGGKFDFSAALLHIPADTMVSIHATATDRFPDRAASLSSLHQIYVLSREAHARLIQERLEKLNAQLEEVARRQEALLEEGKSLRAQDPEKLAEPASAKKLAEQANEQKETAAQLAALAQEMAKTLREAMRNKDLSPSALQEMAEHAQAMQEMAQQGMPAASQSLSAAQSDPAKREPKLDQALAQEEKILKELREMLKSSETSLEKLMAQNLARRLRKIADWEKSITSDFAKILPETVGMKTEDLAEDPRASVVRMATLQENGRGETGRLQGEITRLFERTQLSRYGDVSTDMEKRKTDEALGKLGTLIGQNVSVLSMEKTGEWAKQFTEWADRLDEKDDSKTADANGAGKASAADMRALLALMRVRQHEDELRDRTVGLEKQKTGNPHHQSDARAAADRQKELQVAIRLMQDEPGFPVPKQALEPVSTAMGDAAVTLDKPETGAPAVNAETDSLNLLDAIILAQSKKSGKGAAGLMAMMGMGAGNSPGGNPGGGDTDRTNIHIPGTRTGPKAEERTVMQAGGTTTGALPTEFRDAIESYQRAIEQEGGL